MRASYDPVDEFSEGSAAISKCLPRLRSVARRGANGAGGVGTLYMSGDEPKDGDRYVVSQSFEAIVIVQFFAPFTDGATKILPTGLEFSIWGDPVAAARGVSARPIDPEKWASELVSSKNLNDPKYGGYSFSITKIDLAESCIKID